MTALVEAKEGPPMSRRWLSTVVVTFCCLPGAATPTSAAWVLWMHTTGTLNDAPVPAGDDWSPLSVQNHTESECHATRENTAFPTVLASYTRGKHDGTEVVVRPVIERNGHTGITLSWADGKGAHLTKTRLVCLPDTVDQRGPKGK